MRPLTVADRDPQEFDVLRSGDDTYTLADMMTARCAICEVNAGEDGVPERVDPVAITDDFEYVYRADGGPVTVEEAEPTHCEPPHR